MLSASDRGNYIEFLLNPFDPTRFEPGFVLIGRGLHFIASPEISILIISVIGPNNHFKIRLYLFFFDLITTSIRNSILFIKGKLYLKKKFLHKFPEINLEETRNKILKIQKVLNYKNSIKIKKIGKELINISQI